MLELKLPRSAAVSLAVLLSFVPAAGCAPKGTPTASSATTPSAAASPAVATNSAKKKTPIVFVAPHTGDKYTYVTKRNRRNQLVYVLRADAEKGIYFGENTGQSTFVNPHITFYGSDGKKLVADAPAGLAIERLRTMRLSGGAHALSQDGVKLRSDAMTYDGTTETIHAEGNVVMDSPQGSELTGNTLDWNLHTGSVSVAGAH